MSPLKDSDLIVRTDTAVFATSVEENVVKIIHGTPLAGMGLFIVIPPTTVGAPTLTVTIHADTTTAPTTASNVIAQRSGMAADGEYVVPFNTRCRGLNFNFAAVAGGTSEQHSAIEAWIVDMGVAQDYTRTVEFE